MTRLPELSLFFPLYNEEANTEALVGEALAELPALAERFEIILVDDGSRDQTPAITDRLATAHPDLVRVIHHRPNRGYGGALRSGFGAARYAWTAFLDGDRQFRVRDLARLIERSRESDLVVGYRIRRADPPLRLLYARLYRLANRIFWGLRVRDVDCAAKLVRTERLAGVRVGSDSAFFSAELLIRLSWSGLHPLEVGVPHHPRTAGSPTGARPRVVLRAAGDFWRLRLLRWVAPARAEAGGWPLRPGG